MAKKYFVKESALGVFFNKRYYTIPNIISENFLLFGNED
jgi:hypothetical protein